MARQKIGEFLKMAFLPSVARLRASDPERGGKVEKRLASVLDVADEYDAAMETTESNVDLTPRGKVKERERAVRRAWERLAGIEAETQKLDLYRQQVEKELTACVSIKRPSDAGERISFEMRAREVRDSMRGLDPIIRDAVYVSTSDSFALAAMEDAPPVAVATPDAHGLPGLARLEPLISPEKITESRIARANAAAPEAAEELAAVVSQQQLYRSAIAQTRQQILKEHPLAGGDPLADVVAAAGK